MIIQMTKRTVYYPTSRDKATILLGGTRRVLLFRTAIMVDGGWIESHRTQSGLWPSGRAAIRSCKGC
jgi:hypothetical protein